MEIAGRGYETNRKQWRFSEAVVPVPFRGKEVAIGKDQVSLGRLHHCLITDPAFSLLKTIVSPAAFAIKRRLAEKCRRPQATSK